MRHCEPIGTIIRCHPLGRNMEEILHAKLFKQQYASYVGVWTDENGETHIDPSVWLRHLEDAILTAENNNQLAIWDIKNMVSIYLD